MAKSIIECVISDAIKDIRMSPVPNAAPVIALIDDSYNDGILTGEQRVTLIESATTAARQQMARIQQAKIISRREGFRHG